MIFSSILVFFKANPMLLKLLGVIAIVITLIVAYNQKANSLINQGVAQESARRDKIDEARKAASDKALAAANGRVRVAEQQLAESSIKTARQEMELQHVKTDNQLMQSSLIARDKRLRVLIASSDSAGNSQNPSAGQVGKGTSTTAELDGAVAANLVSLIGIGDQAIIRLNACIDAYDAVEKAVNSTVTIMQ